MELGLSKTGGIDEEQTQPRGERREDDDAWKVVGCRASDVDLVPVVKTVGAGEREPEHEAGDKDQADTEVAGLEFAHEGLDEREGDSEATGVSEDKCAPQRSCPRAAPGAA